jgi:hypothetical protein
MEDSIQELEPEVIKDITSGKCILFLGPELLISKQGKYYKSFFKELESEKSEVLKYFARDNLFSISGRTQTLDKRRLIAKMTEFYNDAGDDIILNLISQIPFSLIINVAPDTGINKLFEKNNFNFRQAYFPDPASNDIVAPSIDNPVIFNIFGRVEDNQSLIVTHDDLFRAIKALMQKGSIPPGIHNCLKNAGSFIFLGLKFETWYYQLLLSILEIEESASLRIGAPYEVDTDTVSVMNSYFQISFAKNNPLKVIQNIYDELAKNHQCLRKPIAEAPKTVAYISYAWKDGANQKREEFVDLIYDELTVKSGVKIYRDRNVLTIQDSIISFMNRIGRGKAVIIVISDKYLKSEYCMYEAWEVYKNNNFNDRVFIAVLPDVDFSETGINGYMSYWKKKKDDLGNMLTAEFKDDLPAINSLIAKNKNLFFVYLFIADFLKIINDTLHYQVPVEFTAGNELAKPEFENFTRLILKKLNEVQ